MTPAVLAELEVWATGCKPYRQHEAFTLAGHVPALVAEVRRLRAALESVDECSRRVCEYPDPGCCGGCADIARAALDEPETEGVAR